METRGAETETTKGKSFVPQISRAGRLDFITYQSGTACWKTNVKYNKRVNYQEQAIVMTMHLSSNTKESSCSNRLGNCTRMRVR